MKKGLTFLSIAMLVFGCAGPQIKEAVDELTPKIDELTTMLLGATVMFETVDAFDAKLGEKLSKDDIAKLSSEIENTKISIGTVLQLEKDIIMIGDSLMALDKKAKGDVKNTIAPLIGKVAGLKASIDEFKTLDTIVAEMKNRVAELEKSPAKVTTAPATPVKAPPATKK